jgi:hypothetical protein
METQKKETKILISKNDQVGIDHIENLKQRAKEATDIIRVFNQVHLLNPITNEAQVLEFLKNPVAFLDARISSDLEFKAKVQPLPAEIAPIFGIDYKGIAEKIAACKLRNLKNMVFVEKTQSIEFDKSCTKKVLEIFYDYSTNKQEIEEITKIRALCKLLNEYCIRWNVDSNDMHLVSDRLGLRCELIPGSKQNDPGSHHYFKENITVIRSKLEYEQIHES